MRTAVFYFSMADGPGRQRITLPNGISFAFIRVEQYDDISLTETLDRAWPADDEMVMNSHELKENR